MENCRRMDAAVKPPSPVLVLSQHDVNVVIIILVVVAFIIVIQPLILSATFRKQGKTEAEVKNGAQSFFEIPYITWFLVHYGIAALAVIAIVILGLDNVIDKSTVAALLGSLFGYVLGSSSNRSSSTQTPPFVPKAPPAGTPTVNQPAVAPPAAAAPVNPPASAPPVLAPPVKPPDAN